MFLKKFLKRSIKEKMSVEGKIIWKRVYRDFLKDKEKKYSFTISSSSKYVICFSKNNDYYVFGVYSNEGIKFTLNIFNQDIRNVNKAKNEVVFHAKTYEYKILKRLFDKIKKEYELKDKISFYEGIRKI